MALRTNSQAKHDRLWQHWLNTLRITLFYKCPAWVKMGPTLLPFPHPHPLLPHLLPPFPILHCQVDTSPIIVAASHYRLPIPCSCYFPSYSSYPWTPFPANKRSTLILCWWYCWFAYLLYVAAASWPFVRLLWIAIIYLVYLYCLFWNNKTTCLKKNGLLIEQPLHLAVV